MKTPKEIHVDPFEKPFSNEYISVFDVDLICTPITIS